MISLQLTGCAVGYITFHTEDWISAQPTPNLANVKVSCNDNGKIPQQCFSLERVLRSRFHILDIQSVPQTGIHSETKRFVIRPELAPDTYWGVGKISCYVPSFSVIPGVCEKEYSIVFTIIAPEGEDKTFRYRYSERLYNWLPFAFFGAGYLGTFDTNRDYYGEDRTKILDDITARFMTEAAPFILSHVVRPE
jgi:hypothetical protein